MIRLFKRKIVFLTACFCLLSLAAAAQDVPTDYQDVLKSLDRKGDFKAGVLKVNISAQRSEHDDSKRANADAVWLRRLDCVDESLRREPPIKLRWTIRL